MDIQVFDISRHLGKNTPCFGRRAVSGDIAAGTQPESIGAFILFICDAHGGDDYLGARLNRACVIHRYL